MTWTCTSCEFPANEDEACLACGSERPEEEEQTTNELTSLEESSSPEVVVIELPAKEKLDVKLMPPRDGVIDHGLVIDSINNLLLENKVQEGDLIVAIGGQNVDGMGFADAIDLIRRMPRPLAISFEIDEDRRQEVVKKKFQQNKDNDLDTQLTTYAVVFDSGPMGLNLEDGGRYGIDGAVVRALKGQAKTSGMISIGDILYKVNETDVLCMPCLDVMNVLRNATAPKTLQFVPKGKLVDVQRMNSRHSESFQLRESTSHVKQKLMNNPRIVKTDDSDDDDNGYHNQSIAQLILDNEAATVKKGRMYKQGRVMRNWNSRYFVLSVSKIEYFTSPSSTTSRGEMSFLNHRCTVRSLAGTGDVVCRSPNVTAEYLLELRVDDRYMVMACTSELDKRGWIDAIMLAIDASKTVNRTQNLGESLREAKALRTQRTESLSMDGAFLDRNAGGRLSQFNYEAFSTPVIHVAVLSATNLTKSGSSVNAICEVTVGAETFKTPVVRNQRSPVWKHDNAASFEAPNDNMVVEIRIFNQRWLATELITTHTIPLKSLPNMQKTTKKYYLALGVRSAGAVLTLSLEYVNKRKEFEENQQRGQLGSGLNNIGIKNERDDMVKIKADAQMAADDASYHAARAQEEARMLLERSRQMAEAAIAAAREERREDKVALEKAMAEAARAKEEAEKQLAEARRAQEEAQKLIEANRRIQESGVQGPSIFDGYSQLLQDGHSKEDVKKKMEEDGIEEMDIQAFFDGINSYDEKIRALQAEVEKLKWSRSIRHREVGGYDFELQQHIRMDLSGSAIEVPQSKGTHHEPHDIDSTNSFSLASNQGSSRYEETIESSIENYDLSVALFVNISEMCEQMEETQDMCECVLNRLQGIQKLIVEKNVTTSREVVREFAVIRTRFRTFLMKYKQGTPFERLVSARIVIGLLRDFHMAIDSLESQISGEIRENQLNWMKAWERGKQDVEAHLIRLWETNAISVLDSLPDQTAQENALLLLAYEAMSNTDMYSIESSLLSSVRERIIEQSAASVPVVPGWFIPDHEVQREQCHFARGSFGKVYRGAWQNKKVVIKCVNVVSASDERDFSREARVWLRAQHPNVVKFFGACHLTRPCFFVCEEAANGNLTDFLKRNKGCRRALTWRLLRDAALGLQCLHQIGIVHGDLKCNQILVTENLTAKLTDFGMSFVSMESRPVTTSGAVRWKAPELLANEGHAPNFASDVYSFGMCVVEAISGNVPWQSDLPDYAVMYHVTRGTFLNRPAAFVSDVEWEFVLSLCSFDPSKRLGLAEAIEKMEHFSKQEEVNTKRKHDIEQQQNLKMVLSGETIEVSKPNDTHLALHDIDNTNFFSTVFNQGPSRYEETIESSIENYDLSVALFVNISEMCEQMEETQDMCECVLNRLQGIQKLIVEKNDIIIREVVREFAVIRTRLRTFLMKYRQGTPFERLVSARIVVGLLRDFHVAIDSLESQISGEIRENQLNWMEAWERGKQDVEAHLIRLWETNAISVLDSLPDQTAQENALLLLAYEAMSNTDMYSVESSELLSSVRERIIEQSAASVPVVPGWFIPDHEVQREQYHFARGSFGKVYRGAWQNKKVVIKCVDIVSVSDERDFSREARVWLRAQHPNVVKFFGACHLTRPCFFVCEEAANGNLTDFLKGNKESRRALTWRLLRDAALGLQCLHQIGIVHGDLKCNQILVTEDLTAKLAGFGMSFVSMESRPVTTSGAVRWKAPELLANEGHAPNFASDVYSFGMCVVEAISGNVPWQSDLPDIAVIYHVTRGIFLNRPAAFVSDVEWEFVLSLCSFDPSKRLGLAEAIEKMEHFAKQEQLNAAGG